MNMAHNYKIWDSMRKRIDEIMARENCTEDEAIKISIKEDYDINSANWEKYQKEVGELSESEKMKLKELALRHGGNNK